VNRSRNDGVALLVLCSRLSREKRPDLAVEDAACASGRRGCPARLVVAWDSGPHGSPLRRGLEDCPWNGRAPGGPLVRGRAARLCRCQDSTRPSRDVRARRRWRRWLCGTPVVAASTSAVAELVGGVPGSQRQTRTPRACRSSGVTTGSARVERRQAARRVQSRFPGRGPLRPCCVHGLTALESFSSGPEKAPDRALPDGAVGNGYPGGLRLSERSSVTPDLADRTPRVDHSCYMSYGEEPERWRSRTAAALASRRTIRLSPSPCFGPGPSLLETDVR